MSWAAPACDGRHGDAGARDGSDNAGAKLRRSVRRRSTRSRDAPSRSAECGGAASRAPGASSAGIAARARAARCVLAPEQLLVSRHRHRHLDLGRVTVSSRSPSVDDRRLALESCRSTRRTGSRSRPLVRRRACAACVVGLEVLVRSTAEDREEDRVESGRQCRVRDEHRARSSRAAGA